MPTWFSQFFSNEAMSNWGVFLAGVIVTLIGTGITWWWVRKQITRVQVIEVSPQTALIDIAPQVRDKISITYQGHTINSLYQTTLEIRNSGQDLSDLSLIFTFGSHIGEEIFEAVVNDPLDKVQIAITLEENFVKNVQVDRPFLNGYEQHKDKFFLTFFSDKPLNIKVMGGGRGWSVSQMTSAQAKEATTLRYQALLIVSSLLFFGSFLALLFLLPQTIQCLLPFGFLFVVYLFGLVIMFEKAKGKTTSDAIKDTLKAFLISLARRR